MEGGVISASSLHTAEDLARLSIPDKQVELVRGVLVVHEPPGTYHGLVAGAVFHHINGFVGAHNLGVVLPQDTGFTIARDPDTVRAPDVAFVAAEQTRAIAREGFAELAPDLVVEIVSPGDRPGEVLANVGEWLDAGTRLVWVLYPLPDGPEVRVYRGDGGVSMLGPDDLLDGEDVLPGFSCRVRELPE